MWVTLHTYVHFYWRLLRWRKFRTVSQPQRALLSFCLVGMNSESEVREELEKKVQVLVAQSCLTLCDHTTLLCPWNSPGIEPRSPALQAHSLPSEPPGAAEGAGGSLQWYNNPRWLLFFNEVPDFGQWLWQSWCFSTMLTLCSVLWEPLVTFWRGGFGLWYKDLCQLCSEAMRKRLRVEEDGLSLHSGELQLMQAVKFQSKFWSLLWDRA